MFKNWINGWVKLHKEFNRLLLPSDIPRLQKHSNSNTIKIIQISFYSLSFLHCHQGLQIMDADTIKKASRKSSKKSCSPDNKNLLTELFLAPSSYFLELEQMYLWRFVKFFSVLKSLRKARWLRLVLPPDSFLTYTGTIKKNKFLWTIFRIQKQTPFNWF